MNLEQLKFKEEFYKDYDMSIRKSSNTGQLITEMKKLGYQAEVLEGGAVDFCKHPWHVWVNQEHVWEQVNNERMPDKQLNNRKIKI